MNRSQLRDVFTRHGVPESWYTIDGDRDETMCLLYEAPRWIVYYSERGGRGSEQRFREEEDACAYLYEAMLKDLEYYQRRGGPIPGQATP